ncbi:MAG: DNA-3-methyladenine glycosylase [Ferruginibacter sp.]
MKKLTIDFYNRKNVAGIAKELLGKILVTNINGKLTSGRIVETEAYNGILDRAAHSYAGKRTNRNEHMYAQGGLAYIYVCYGIHQMFNVVTNDKEIPEAILIRALEPLDGIKFMLERTGKKLLDFTLTKGPGNVGKAMGIHKDFSGTDLMGDKILIVSDEIMIPDELIGVSSRIGVLYAGEDALLPYRFFVKGNKFVSGKPNK